MSKDADSWPHMKKRTVGIALLRLAGPARGMILSRLLGLTGAPSDFDDILSEGPLRWVRRTPEELAFETGLVTREGEPRTDDVAKILHQLIPARLAHQRHAEACAYYTVNKPVVVEALRAMPPTPYDINAPGTVWAMRAE